MLLRVESQVDFMTRIRVESCTCTGERECYESDRIVRKMAKYLIFFCWFAGEFIKILSEYASPFVGEVGDLDDATFFRDI